MDAGGREEPRHLQGWGPETRGTEQPSVKMGVRGDGWSLGCVAYTHVKSLRKISGPGLRREEYGLERHMGSIRLEMVSRWHLKPGAGGDG